MSPARSKRQPVPHRRSRADIVTAVAVGGGIVLATALLIWLLRPGPPGIPGTGGLMNRQPRSSWLVTAAFLVAGIATWWILRGRRRRSPSAQVLLPVTLGVVLVATVVAGFLWPGGLLRHDVAPKPTPTTSTTKPKGASTTSPAPSTSAGASTTVPGATTPTTAAGSATTTTPSVTTTVTTTAPSASTSTTGKR